MSASVMTAIYQMAFHARPDGMAGRARRAVAAIAATDDGAIENGAIESGAIESGARRVERAYATAWPVLRDPEATLYRCRMWDGVRVSDPFLVRAPHGFLSADPALVLATLAAADENAFNVLRRACLRGFAVEFNQDRHDGTVVAAALERLPARHTGAAQAGAVQ